MMRAPPMPTDWRKQEDNPMKMLRALGEKGVETMASNGDPNALYTKASVRLSKATVNELEMRLAKLELQLAANSGHVYAAERLGRLCVEFGEFAESKECYLRAATAGLPEGMFKMGRCLESGEGGIEMDAPAAAEWYRKAAGSGHAQAACNLRFMRAVGRGVVRSKRLEMLAMLKAAENGDKTSQWTIARAIHIDQPYARQTCLHAWTVKGPNWFTPVEMERVQLLLKTIDERGGDYYCCNESCNVVCCRKDLKVCPQCKLYRYCGAECQGVDWTTGGHKHTCGTYKANFDYKVIKCASASASWFLIDDAKRLRI
jgi:hypothetical protein